MEKIVCFPQIVQIIITPTPFALLWSVSEKVCLTKNTRTFVFEFLKDLSAQKQRVFQTNATLISIVNCLHNLPPYFFIYYTLFLRASKYLFKNFSLFCELYCMIYLGCSKGIIALKNLYFLFISFNTKKFFPLPIQKQTDVSIPKFIIVRIESTIKSYKEICSSLLS